MPLTPIARVDNYMSQYPAFVFPMMSRAQQGAGLMPQANDPRLQPGSSSHEALARAGFTLVSPLAVHQPLRPLQPRITTAHQVTRPPRAQPGFVLNGSPQVPIPPVPNDPIAQPPSGSASITSQPQYTDDPDPVVASRPQTPPLVRTPEDPRPLPTPQKYTDKVQVIPNHSPPIEADISVENHVHADALDHRDNAVPKSVCGTNPAAEIPKTDEDVHMAIAHSPTPEEDPTPVQVKTEPEDQKPATEWLLWDPVSRRTDTWKPPVPAEVSPSIKSEEQSISQPSGITSIESLPTDLIRALTPQAADTEPEQIVEEPLPVLPAACESRTTPTPARRTETPQRRSQTPALEPPTPADTHSRSETPSGVFASQLKVHVLNPDENKFAIVTITASHDSLGPLFLPPC